MAGPLEGIKVLDLTTIYSGPICTSILGDQGADVIKVESPGGDWMRLVLNIQRNGVGGAFAMMNRNKRSIVIDLSKAQGKQLLRKLATDVDVLVENFRPGVMERLGLSYANLKALNPGLVYAAISGVGASGPYAGRRVYDAIVQAVSGFATLQADAQQERPIMVNTLVCDKLTSMTAAQSICAALVAKAHTGVGQRIDIAMLEAALFFLWPDNMLNHTFVGDDVPYAEPLLHSSFVRQTRDGYICTMPIQQDEWLGLFKALELPNLLEDERFSSPEELYSDLFQSLLDDGYKRFDTNELAARLDANQVPFAIINSREEVITDPQVQAMGSLLEFEHPFGGPMRQARPPSRFSETPSEIFRCSPELGEHTVEVLEGFGISADQIKELRAQQVVR